MREILFRGMTEEGEWVYGSYCRHEDDYYIYTSESIVVDPEVNYSENHLIKVEVKPETVGQYTGLKDKNGKRIFEGDRLKIQADEYYSNDNFMLEESNEHKGVAIFYNGCFCLRDQKYMTDLIFNDLFEYDFDVEIIGNVHEESE